MFSFKKPVDPAQRLPRGLRKPGKIRRFFSSRRAKYGSVAVLFSVIFITVVILLNVLLSGLAEHTPLAADVTASAVFTLSDTSKTLIAQSFPEAEKPQVLLQFMMPQDRLKSGEYTNMVLECAKSYEEAFSNVKVEYLDLVSRPGDVRAYQELGLEISSTTVVVNCPAKARVKTFGVEACFIKKSDSDAYYGFDGETQFTAAIMAVSRDRTPVVTFTQGHGETRASQLERMFTTAGYTVKYQNLALEPIGADTQIIVIHEPHTDFLGLFAGSDNEIDRLAEYLNDYRDLFVFLSPDTPVLPELDALLEEWGVRVARGQTIIDEVQSVAGSGGTTLAADFAGASYLAYTDTDTANDEEYSSAYASIGSALHKNLSKQDSPPSVLVSSAAPVELLYEGEFSDGTRSIDSVLQSSKNAYCVDENGTKQVGVYTLMAISSRYGYEGDDTNYTHVLVCGSGSFSEYVAAGDSYYGNSDILYSAMTLMSKELAPEGVNMKKLDDTSLSITEGEAQGMLVLMVTVLPVIVFALGGAVFFKRRHK